MAPSVLYPPPIYSLSDTSELRVSSTSFRDIMGIPTLQDSDYSADDGGYRCQHEEDHELVRYHRFNRKRKASQLWVSSTSFRAIALSNSNGHAYQVVTYSKKGLC